MSAVEFVSERVTRRVAHTVVSAVGFVSDSLDSILLAHVSHQSELFRAELLGAAFLQLTGDACISTQREAHQVIHICLSAEGAGKGHCDVSMGSACNLSIHVSKHRGQPIIRPCGHYCDSSMITC